LLFISSGRDISVSMSLPKAYHQDIHYLFITCHRRYKYGCRRRSISRRHPKSILVPHIPKFWYNLHQHLYSTYCTRYTTTMIPTLDFLLPSLHPSTLLDVSFPITGPGTANEPIVKSLPIKYGEYAPVGIVKRMLALEGDQVSSIFQATSDQS
jgi:hypothetical protein